MYYLFLYEPLATSGLTARSGFCPYRINRFLAHPALLSFNEGGANGLDFFRGFLFPDLPLADEFANHFTFIPEMPGRDLGLDPFVLPVCHRKYFFSPLPCFDPPLAGHIIPT